MALFEIKNRWSGSLLFSLECGSMKLCIEAAVGGDANLRDANLRGADLSGADLGGANLRGADLRDADLSGAELSDANLRDANLRGANLRDADLCDANLRGADLRGARMDTGETYQEYVTEILPALLTAGGKPIESFREHWQCHSWDNCPMAHGFGVNGLDGIPPIHRALARQFVSRFDKGMLPQTALEQAIAAAGGKPADAPAA